ncbi:MAG: hypothetical protein WC346_18915, partial [Methanogenium sp.]
SVNGDTGLTKTDRRETQKEIEKLFGINLRTLSVSTIFEQESVSFPKAKESERKEILYSYFDFSEYLKLFNLAKERHDELVNNISKANQRIQLNKSLLDSYEKDKQEREVLAAKFEVDRELTNATLERAIKAAAIILEGSQRDYSSSIDALEKTIIEIDEDCLKEAQEHMAIIATSISRYQTLLDSNVKEYKKLQNSQCPVLNELCEKLQVRNDSILVEKEAQMNCQNERILRLKAAFSEYEKKCAEIQADVQKNKQTYQEIEKFRKLAKSEEQSLVAARKDLAEFEAKLVANKAVENPYLGTADTLDKKIKYVTEATGRYMKLVSKQEEELAYYKFWMTAFSKTGIPNMKIEGFLQSLELETNKYLSSISDRMSVQISSQTELKNKDTKEKISYKVFHPDKKITDFRSYSRGQRQRVRVADICAMHKLVSKFGFMIMDEVLEISLDDFGKDSVISLLKEKAKEVDTIFVMSHDDKIKQAFDNTLNVVLENGESKLCQ